MGLQILKEATSKGYNALLVTDRAIGSGQSGRNHGWHHSGVLPLIKGHEKMSGIWGDISKETMQIIKDGKVDFRKAYLEVPQEKNQESWKSRVDFKSLGAPENNSSMVRYEVGDGCFSKTGLFRHLANGLEKRIVCNAEVTAIDFDGDVPIVNVEKMSIRAKTVAICAGTGTGKILQQSSSEEKSSLTEKMDLHHSSWVINVLCVKGPYSIMPKKPLIITQPPTIIGMNFDLPDETTLLITANPGPKPLLQEMPNDGLADANKQALKDASDHLFQIYPELKEKVSELRFAGHAAHKHCAGWVEKKMQPFAGQVADSNVFVVNPQFVMGISRASKMFFEKVEPLIGDPTEQENVTDTRPKKLRNKKKKVAFADFREHTLDYLTFEKFQESLGE